ncbi:MAG TPA: hypothetical protein VGI74_07840 [Streptosporangiaceae bacterium]
MSTDIGKNIGTRISNYVAWFSSLSIFTGVTASGRIRWLQFGDFLSF